MDNESILNKMKQFKEILQQELREKSPKKI